jgi:hypothetical protein
MTWNYRIVKANDGYGLHEIYYDENGIPNARTQEPILMGENQDDIVADLKMMLCDAQKPIIDDKEFQKQESITMNCYLLFTDVGPFCFQSELDTVNFMIDAKTGRLPYSEIGYEETKEYNGVYSNCRDAVDEYLRRDKILREEFVWLRHRFTH